MIWPIHTLFIPFTLLHLLELRKFIFIWSIILGFLLISLSIFVDLIIFLRKHCWIHVFMWGRRGVLSHLPIRFILLNGLQLSIQFPYIIFDVIIQFTFINHMFWIFMIDPLWTSLMIRFSTNIVHSL